MRALEGDIVLLVSVTAVHVQLEHVGNTWTMNSWVFVDLSYRPI